MDKAGEIVARIRALEEELELEFERRREKLRFRIKDRRIEFEREAQAQHRALKQKLSSYLAGARLSVVLTAPVIYSIIVPFVLLDLFVSVYQAICFPAYGIEKVKRSDFITFDRRHLSYLNGLEKLNCMYCAYGNGLLGYAAEIAARTEKRWCPIKHAKRMAGVHRHYADFLEYGDAVGYRAHQSSSGGTPNP